MRFFQYDVGPLGMFLVENTIQNMPNNSLLKIINYITILALSIYNLPPQEEGIRR